MIQSSIESADSIEFNKRENVDPMDQIRNSNGRSKVQILKSGESKNKLML